MRCLCYQECVCGTPEVDIDPDIERFADNVRNLELERVASRSQFLEVDASIPDTRTDEKPSGLRHVLWELVKMLAPMDGKPSLRNLKSVSKRNA